MYFPSSIDRTVMNSNTTTVRTSSLFRDAFEIQVRNFPNFFGLRMFFMNSPNSYHRNKSSEVNKINLVNLVDISASDFDARRQRESSSNLLVIIHKSW